MIHALTIDVEDWFHILDLKNGCGIKDYASMESRVEKNTHGLLEILDRHQVKGTFFVLGWVAEHFPDLVRTIHSRGHEIASHGYGHILCYEMTPDEFREDTLKSLDVLEGITGEKVLGYRVPGYSIMQGNLWALDILLDLGIVYDSSVFPAKRGHGGFPGAPRVPYRQRTPKGRTLFEFPVSCLRLLNTHIPFSGGGYFRLLPYPLIKWGIRQYVRSGHPVNVYLHPREIDPQQPRLDMPLYRHFKSYINLKTTEKKLSALLRDFDFGRLKDLINDLKET